MNGLLVTLLCDVSGHQVHGRFSGLDKKKLTGVMFSGSRVRSRTGDHLFLRCEYSRQVWREIFIRCHPPLSPLSYWSELLSWIRAAASTKLKLLRKLATQTIIFHLWKQRNNLTHNQISLSAASVFHGINREMRNIISARKQRKHLCFLMVVWLR